MTDQPLVLGTWRCARCKRLLAKVRIVDGEIEIKCSSCNRINTWPLSQAVQPTG